MLHLATILPPHNISVEPFATSLWFDEMVKLGIANGRFDTTCCKAFWSLDFASMVVTLTKELLLTAEDIRIEHSLKHLVSHQVQHSPKPTWNDLLLSRCEPQWLSFILDGWCSSVCSYPTFLEQWKMKHDSGFKLSFISSAQSHKHI